MDKIRLSSISVRTFGWVQNPSDFKKLKKVVQVFDSKSATHNNLKTNRITQLIAESDGRAYFIKELNKIPLKLKYKDLTGSAFQPRANARCNGIIQATIEGQGKKKFVDDWTSDGFIRWAHALGFIDYDYYNDAFYITNSGLNYSQSIDGSDDERKILINALLSYPPAVRILNLLSNGNHLTKYDIGKMLGFSGEPGFTSLPQNILINSLAICTDINERNKMKSDWDGSSDKYARMISGWLSKLGLVEKVPKEFNVNISGSEKIVTIPHAFKITPEGLKQLRRANGISKSQKIIKRVYWEMLATKKTDKVYVRTRRAYILKILQGQSKIFNINEIKKILSSKGLEENIETIENDIKGLINIGLNVEITSRGYILKDSINEFIIPIINTEEIQKSTIEETKSNLRTKLTCVPHNYVELIEIAQDPKQNRLFEMKVMALLVDELNFHGKHLGGSRKPDGAVYTQDYGIIVDTKAYKNGYNLPISQADEMERYIRENKDRNIEVNPNKWWTLFPNNINCFVFLFVSSFFKGNFESQLKRISINTGQNGATINIENLLLITELFKKNIINHKNIYDMFKNKEINLNVNNLLKNFN